MRVTPSLHQPAPEGQPAPEDVQARVPAVRVGLSRVGVTGVEKVVRIRDELFFARLECFVDLSHDQKGAHMSRFEEVVNEAIGEVVLTQSQFRAETLARNIAELVRTRQGAARAEVTVQARYPEHKPPPSRVSPRRRSTRSTAAPWRSRAARATWWGSPRRGSPPAPARRSSSPARARERLSEQEGFSDEQIERILAQVPVATHNQRGLGTLQIGCLEGCEAEIDAKTLLEIVEGSMSSEIYELMKRSDEVEVVEKAHRRPRFVEDCVREMVAGVVAPSPGWTAPASSPRARRTSRRSTSTTSSPNATVCSRSCAGRSTPASPPRIRPLWRSGSEAGAAFPPPR